jgi:outer membrane protein
MKKMNFDKVLLYTSSLLLAGILGVTIKNQFGSPKTVYVDIGKMQEGYKFKKDLEAEGTKNLYKIKNAIDSLKMIDKVDANPVIDSQIMYAERAFNQYYTYSNQEMTKKIWERLNPLLEEFGKQNNYEMIVGANGAGTVLYGNKENDVTEQAINFINKKYEKGN